MATEENPYLVEQGITVFGKPVFTDENGDKRFIRDDRRSVKGKTFSRSAVRVVRLRSV